MDYNQLDMHYKICLIIKKIFEIRNILNIKKNNKNNLINYK